MKRRDLIKKLERAADAQGVSFVFDHEGGNHTVFKFAGQNIAVPRHAEINEHTAKGILRTVGAR